MTQCDNLGLKGKCGKFSGMNKSNLTLKQVIFIPDY